MLTITGVTEASPDPISPPEVKRDAAGQRRGTIRRPESTPRFRSRRLDRAVEGLEVGGVHGSAITQPGGQARARASPVETQGPFRAGWVTYPSNAKVRSCTAVRYRLMAQPILCENQARRSGYRDERSVGIAEMLAVQNSAYDSARN